MMIDSKVLFQRLLHNLTLEESQAEKEAIIIRVMENLLGMTRSEVVMGKSVNFDPDLFINILHRINQYEPVQYILKEAEFYGRAFYVNPAVLIPRPETELLIGVVVDQIKGLKNQSRILDIGTGSGCIAVTLALEIKSASIHATDVSDDALAVAKLNAEKLGAKIQFHHHDIVNDELTLGLFDLIASNPPYIPAKQKESLQKNVRDYEPGLALFAPDSDPLLFYKAIAGKSFRQLQTGGLLITEIHESFGEKTKALFHTAGFKNIQILKDLSGKDRLVTGINPD